jgi:hypothetical protein
MMPDLDPRKERAKKRTNLGVCIAIVAMTVLLLIEPGWTWVPVAGVIAISAIVTIASGNLPGGHRRGGGLLGRGRDIHGRGSGFSGRGRDDDGPAGAAARRWRVLAIVSRLMPPSAGGRWLAEAESLLSEITATRRGAAIRSYLLSAPRLAVMMWASEVLRRARLGPRRPG